MVLDENNYSYGLWQIIYRDANTFKEEQLGCSEGSEVCPHIALITTWNSEQRNYTQDNSVSGKPRLSRWKQLIFCNMICVGIVSHQLKYILHINHSIIT